VGSSHSRFTSAEDYEEASLLGCPPIGLLDMKSIELAEQKRKKGPYIPGLKPEALRPEW
jgi:hypothetical protein